MFPTFIYPRSSFIENPPLPRRILQLFIYMCIPFQIVCTVIAALLHYIFLVVFLLMLAEGIQVAYTVIVVFNTRSKTRILLTLAWSMC